MIKVKIGIIILCFILLAAHFLRYGWIVLTIITLAVPFLLLIKRNWSRVLLQIALIAGALEWLRTIVITTQIRMEMDQPWIRMVVILALIVLLNLYAALSLQSPKMKKLFVTG